MDAIEPDRAAGRRCRRGRRGLSATAAGSGGHVARVHAPGSGCPRARSCIGCARSLDAVAASALLPRRLWPLLDLVGGLGLALAGGSGRACLAGFRPDAGELRCGRGSLRRSAGRRWSAAETRAGRCRRLPLPVLPRSRSPDCVRRPPRPFQEPCGRLGLCGGLAPVGAAARTVGSGRLHGASCGKSGGRARLLQRGKPYAFVDKGRQMREVRLPRRRGARVAKGDGL